MLNLVSSTYRGNYTTSYAVNNDDKAYEKETWVYAKGVIRAIRTYLVWINRAYQHVNVFTGSKGNWKLNKELCRRHGCIGYRDPGRRHQSHLQAQGRLDHEHVHRSSGRGLLSGYRLCVPFPSVHAEYGQGIRLQAAGYPVSHGGVRMQKKDVNWIYDNVPIGSTVVIF